MREKGQTEVAKTLETPVFSRGIEILTEKLLLRGIRPSYGGGARGGGSPPRVGSNALNALHGKAFSERSEDFSAAQRRESNGIFSGCRKSP